MLFQKEVKIGEVVRSRKTREMFLVVDKTTAGVFVINLMLNVSPAVIQCILPGYTDEWDRDVDIDDLEEWEAELINKKMPLIEELDGVGLNKQLFTGEPDGI